MLVSHFLAAVALVSTSSSSAWAAPTKDKRQNRKMRWFGINEAGAEFGENVIPGVYGKDYTWYDLGKMDTLFDQGMNMFRINFCT